MVKSSIITPRTSSSIASSSMRIIILVLHTTKLRRKTGGAKKHHAARFGQLTPLECTVDMYESYFLRWKSKRRGTQQGLSYLDLIPRTYPGTQTTRDIAHICTYLPQLVLLPTTWGEKRQHLYHHSTICLENHETASSLTLHLQLHFADALTETADQKAGEQPQTGLSLSGLLTTSFCTGVHAI